jgi:hypothetical protein
MFEKKQFISGEYASRQISAWQVVRQKRPAATEIVTGLNISVQVIV